MIAFPRPTDDLRDGTAQRYWMLRRHVDRRVLLGFGIASAAGGLMGALVHVRVSSPALTLVFGTVVVLQASGRSWSPRRPR